MLSARARSQPMCAAQKGYKCLHWERAGQGRGVKQSSPRELTVRGMTNAKQRLAHLGAISPHIKGSQHRRGRMAESKRGRSADTGLA